VKFSGALPDAQVDALLDAAWRIVDEKCVGRIVGNGATTRANPAAAAA